MRIHFLILPLCAAAALAACGQQPVATPVPVAEEIPFKLTASVQEIMRNIVDPSADVVWNSVGTTLTAKGAEEHRPKTDEEWAEVRRNAIIFTEATNLLMMKGRRMVPVGGKVLDEGAEGVLTSVTGQQKIEEQHAAFVQFAGALHDTGEKMIAAIDKKDVDAMLELGTEMDGVCEACHMTFWYPNQLLPKKLTPEAMKKLSESK